MDLVITNGTVVTDSGVSDSDVGIEDGRVAALGRNLTGRSRLDATGKYVLPGMVDPHVHLLDLTDTRTVTDRQADDFDSGTRAAAQGGVTMVVDFAYQPPGRSIRSAIEHSDDEARGRAWVDYSFHCWITDPSGAVFGEVSNLIAGGFPSFKIFMESDSFDERAVEYMRLMEAIGEGGGLVLLHCEDRQLRDFCTERQTKKGENSVEFYPLAKPPSVEVAATARAVEMCRVTGAPIYVVHVSCEGALAVLRPARRAGLPVFVETRPLYLHLDEQRFREPNGLGAKYLGTPPLRTDHDRQALWSGLAAREIDVVATDHVGWSLEQKLWHRDIPEIASGVHALATNLPLMHSEGVLQGRLSLSRMVELLSSAPARLLGVFPRKGTIAVGSDADLVVFDPAKDVTIRADELQGASDFDPFEGFEVRGWPETTIVGGSIVFDRGELTTNHPSGKLVHRDANAGLLGASLG